MREHPVIEHLPREQRIRAIAYALWEEEGRPEGRAEAHWLRAVELVDMEARAPDWLQRGPEPAVTEPPIRATLEELVQMVAKGRAA